jgi:hypothetical protein
MIARISSSEAPRWRPKLLKALLLIAPFGPAGNARVLSVTENARFALSSFL